MLRQPDNPQILQSGAGVTPGRSHEVEDGVFRAAFQRAAVGIALCDIDGRFISINRRFAELTGYTEAELCGRAFAEITHPDDLPANLALVEEVRAGRRPSIAFEKRYLRKTGETVPVRLTIALADLDGAVGRGFVATAEDISGQKQAEARLAANLRRTGDILASISDGYVTIDRDWVYTDVNDKAAMLLGKTPQEMLHRCVWDVFPTAHGSPWHHRMRQVMETGEPSQIIEHNPVRDRWYQAGITPFHGGIALSFHDVTEERQLQASLEERENLLRQGAQLGRFGTWVWDITADRCMFCSEELAALFGMTIEEYLRDRGTLQKLRAFVSDECQNLFSDTIIKEPGVTYDVEFRIKNKAGAWLHIREHARTYRDEATGNIFCLGISQDVTEVKQNEMELRRLAEEAAELARLAEQANRAKSEFLASMSHELRTPLNAIIGFSEMLLEMEGVLPPEKVQDYHGTIRESGMHLLAVINDILDLAKVEAGKMELQYAAVDLGGVVAECISYLEPAARERRVTIATDQDWPVLRSDRRLVKQILLNLMSNAVKFNHPGGTLTVGVRADDAQLAISVTDTGIGMTPAEIDRVLKPFSQVESTYHRTHEGSGLGLTLVERFTELLGGTLEIRSEKERGTTVVVTLPRVAPEPAEAAS